MSSNSQFFSYPTVAIGELKADVNAANEDDGKNHAELTEPWDEIILVFMIYQQRKKQNYSKHKIKLLSNRKILNLKDFFRIGNVILNYLCLKCIFC